MKDPGPTIYGEAKMTQYLQERFFWADVSSDSVAPDSVSSDSVSSDSVPASRMPWSVIDLVKIPCSWVRFAGDCLAVGPSNKAGAKLLLNNRALHRLALLSLSRTVRLMSAVILFATFATGLMLVVSGRGFGLAAATSAPVVSHVSYVGAQESVAQSTGDVKDTAASTDQTTESSAQDSHGFRDPSEVFSKDTIAYAEVTSPGKIIQRLLDHPLRQKIDGLPPVQQALKGPQFAAFNVGLGMFQVYTGMEWQESLEVLAGKGVSIGFDSQQNAIGLVLVSGDSKRLANLCEGLVRLGNLSDKNAVKSGRYRDVTAYTLNNQVFLIPLEDRLFVSNKKDMAKSMVDLWIDGGESLLATSVFQKTKAGNVSKDAWGFLDLETVRNSGLARDLFRDKAENIAEELLVGGLLHSLQTSDHISGSIAIKEEQIQLTVSAPFQQDQVPSQRQYFFGTLQQRDVFQEMVFPEALANITTFRDVGQLWLSKEELFDEKHLSELAQADSTLSTLFSGLDFGEEVLGATEPGVQIVVRNQDYSQIATPQPDIKLPEFALVFRLKDSRTIQRRFKVAYQSLIGFLNIQLAMEGNPQLEMESELIEGGKVISATYLVFEDSEFADDSEIKGDAGTRKYGEGIINYNFSPSIAFSDQWFFVSSTRQLADDLVRSAKSGLASVSPDSNTSIVVQGPQLKTILNANKEQLVANNMLEEGNDRETAASQIGLLINLIDFVKQLKLELLRSDDRLELEFAVDFNLPVEAAPAQSDDVSADQELVEGTRK